MALFPPYQEFHLITAAVLLKAGPYGSHIAIISEIINRNNIYTVHITHITPLIPHS